MAQRKLTYYDGSEDNNDPQTDNTGQNTTPIDLSNKMAQLSANYPTPILDQYGQLAMHPPDPNDFRPNKFQQIMAALAGWGASASPAGMGEGGPVGFRYDPVAGFRAKEAIVGAPYDKAMSNWDTRVKALGTAAGVEEKQIANKRQLATAEARQALGEEANRIRQQQADTQAQKERDIYETQQKKLQQQLDEANAKLDLATKVAGQKNDNAQAQLDLRRAQLDAQTALHNLQVAQKDRQIKDAEDQHKAQQDKWDKDRAELEQRLKIMQQNADTQKNKAGTGPTETTTTTVTGQKPGWSILGMHVPFTGSAGTTKTSDTVKKPLNTAAVPDNVKAALKGQSAGKHTLSDGSVWIIDNNGNISKGQ